jgi:NIPSNAP protein
MNRRDFVAATLAAGGALLGRDAVGAAQAGATGSAPARSPEYYELRRYHLRRGPQTKIVDDYWRLAALPALQRAGVGPVGAFNVMIGADSPSLYVLLVHPTLDSFASLPARLAADTEYQSAGAAYLNAAATDPAFVRLNSSLMRAFEGIPKLELPFGGGENGRKPRIFELRTYESHSEKAAKKKIEIFNTAEIAIFRRAGMHPVFFGETIAGSNMPNLTYMLVYENMAAHDTQWAAFSADPEWRKISTTPGNTDPEIVANISNTYLRPAAYSQI